MSEDQNAIKPAGPPKELKKISDTIWELPISYKQGMRVPARIIASEELIKSMDAGVFNQVSNVACLPGIQKYAYCMPDGHWGYGFPIGGVAAFDIENGGVISPGGIGFDINCLVKGSKILTQYGFSMAIEEFEREFTDETLNVGEYNLKLKKCAHKVTSFDLDTKSFSPKEVAMFMKKKHAGSVYRITTKLGYTLEVTGDHPILTSQGMINAVELKEGQEIAVYPFEGTSYQKIDSILIVHDETLFTKQELDELLKRDLFPLNLKSNSVPIITKLFGYLIGDGQIYLSKEKGFVCAYGEKEDLETIKNDFVTLGFSAQIYGRRRDHTIQTKYGAVSFNRENFELHVSSKALAKLFFALGYPRGKKTNTPFEVPFWIRQGPLWLQRLFLSGLFGAELSKPRTHTKTGFDCPTLSMNKNTNLLDNARNYCIQIITMLEGFGVDVHKLLVRDDFVNLQGKTSRLKLQISSQEENLLRLWSNIGFSYNHKT